MPAPFRAAAAALLFASAAGAAHAEDASKWFVHLGPAIVAPSESATLTAGGAPVAGANVSIKSRWTFEGEVGRYLTPNIAVAVAAGAPPKFTIKGAGTLASVGTAGKMTGGPAGIFVQYHINRGGMIQPYVGAGGALLLVFGTNDGVLTNLHAKSAVGPAVQVGADVMFNDRWGAFVDVKKAWIKTTATGMLGPAPVRARVTVDPLVPHAGVAYHF